MCRRFLLIFIFALCTPQAYGVESDAELNKQVRELAQQVKALSNELDRLQKEQQKFKVNAESVKIEDYGSAASASSSVNLSTDELPSLDDDQKSHVLANPWWKNIQINGFGAAGFYDTGAAGTRDHGGFEIKEASLFIEAEVWEDVAFFVEFQTNRLGFDSQRFTQTGEVYIQVKDIDLGGDASLGFKLGRVDIPFGEEYLWQDAIDNPLITNSVAYPYAWDEGIVIYSEIMGINWIASITDGLLSRSKEENSDKTYSFKVSADPLDSLYLSLSLMSTGDTSRSAWQFAGSFLQPVGDRHESTLGTSSSSEVDAFLYEADAKYEFELAGRNGYLALTLGSAQLNDDDSQFDRDFHWFSIEPLLNLNDDWYTVLRYSEIGTYDDDEGYHFSGKTFAGGNDAFGYDTERLRRLGLGLGWKPNPRLLTKLEIGKDWFDVIDASPLSTNNSDRIFVGFEMAVRF